MPAPALTHGLLDALRERWVRAGLDHLDRALQPALGHREIDELLAPLGISMPAEIRTWFGWHDGADGYPWTLGLDLWSLSGAVRENELQRNIARMIRDDNVGSIGGLTWSDSWFGFTGSDTVAYVEATPAAPVSPVWRWSTDVGREERPVFQSVGAMVEAAIEAWDCGWYVGWDRGWILDDRRKPAAPRIW